MWIAGSSAKKVASGITPHLMIFENDYPLPRNLGARRDPQNRALSRSSYADLPVSL
jgi:hypothetical protein